VLISLSCEVKQDDAGFADPPWCGTELWKYNRQVQRNRGENNLFGLFYNVFCLRNSVSTRNGKIKFIEPLREWIAIARHLHATLPK
jgi:hypothetical protein